MKTKHTLALFTAVALSASAVYAADVKIVVPQVVVPHATYGVYETLPSDYDGEYYLYNKRYYYGGKYESGPFKNEGHDYDGRYLHDGKYVYGGKFDHSKHKKHHKK